MLAVIDEVGDERVLIDVSFEEGAALVESEDAVVGEVASHEENGLAGDARLVDLLAGDHLVEVEES